MLLFKEDSPYVDLLDNRGTWIEKGIRFLGNPLGVLLSLLLADIVGVVLSYSSSIFFFFF
jgi:hypothetical protein